MLCMQFLLPTVLSNVLMNASTTEKNKHLYTIQLVLLNVDALRSNECNWVDLLKE